MGEASDESEHSSANMPPEEGHAASPDGLIWRFEQFVLDERGPELSREGRIIESQGKPLQLLAYLLEHAGEVVTKDELLEHCWSGQLPSESVLTKAIAKLRGVLHDHDQRLIKTVYGHGYRFAVGVRREAVGSLTRPHRELKPGDRPAQRPLWSLYRRLDQRGQTWSVRHDKTGELRLFKFAHDPKGLRGLKREITMFRLLEETPVARGRYRRLMDWNLSAPPYFIEAEYIEGGSLPDWIQGQGGWQAVPLEQRLELTAQVAAALDAAHQAGVLHKDLKPANVLVDTSSGNPRVLLADFGSGGPLDRERLSALGVTQLGFTQTLHVADPLSFTPLYAAPEVVAGEMPTMQSDIYALGVVLYQVLTEDWRRMPAPGWEREIDDPLLRDDIALCTDAVPARRLDRAGLLSERLRNLEMRHSRRMMDLAVAEQQALLMKQLSRQRARRPWIIAVAIALLVGLVASTLFAWRARQAEQAARQEASTQAAVTAFMEELLSSSDPLNASGTGDLNITVRQAMERVSASSLPAFRENPEREAATRQLIGQIYRNADEFAPARQQFALALQKARRLGKAGGPMVNELLISIAESYFSEFDRERFLPALAQAREASGLSPEQHLLLDVMDAASPHPDDYDWSGLRQRLAALAPRMESVFGPDRPEFRSWLYERSEAAFHAGDMTEMLAITRRILEIERRRQPDHAGTLLIETTLGDGLVRAGQVSEGLAMLENVAARATGLFPTDSYMSMITASYLGHAYLAAGNLEKAGPLLTESWSRMRKTIGEDSFLTHEAASDLARYYLKRDKAFEALRLLEETRTQAQRRYGEMHMYSRELLAVLAEAKVAAQGPRRAAAEISPIHAQLIRLLGASHWEVHQLGAELGYALQRSGDDKRGRTLLTAALADAQRRYPEIDPRRQRIEELAKDL